jgi:6-phosphogluconolactonase
MRVETFEDADAVAERGAAHIRETLLRAVELRGRASLAVSGGKTPFPMLRRLAAQDLPWAQIDVLQVDERVAPDGDADRNATHLQQAFAACLPEHAQRFHLMPVAGADPGAGAERYARLLRAVAGSPATIDLVELGLGEDGHTASLFPGDAALDVADADVAVTGEHAGHRRMTLTLPALNRARSVLWVVTGDAKRAVLARLLRGDPGLAASRIRRDRARVIADAAACPDRQAGSA